MAMDSTAPGLEAEAPAEADTPVTSTTDTDANTQAPPPSDDWQSRYRHLQSEMTRKAQALAAAERRLAELESASVEEDEEVEEPAPSQRRPSRMSEREYELAQQLEQTQWQIAEATYPPEVIVAYQTFAPLWNRAQTPADHLGAMLAFHEAMLRGATPAQAAASAASSPPAPSAVLPRTDSNRSDSPVLPEIDQEIKEAQKSKDLTRFVAALRRSAEGT